jgi:hypothetical protein
LIWKLKWNAIECHVHTAKRFTKFHFMLMSNTILMWIIKTVYEQNVECV